MKQDYRILVAEQIGNEDIFQRLEDLVNMHLAEGYQLRGSLKIKNNKLVQVVVRYIPEFNPMTD